MRIGIEAAALLVWAVPCVVAQPRLSPHLDRWGGSAYLVTFRAGADMDHVRERLRELGFDLIDHPDLLSADVVAAGPRSTVDRLAEWDDVVYVRPASDPVTTPCAGGVTIVKVIGCELEETAWSANETSNSIELIVIEQK